MKRDYLGVNIGGTKCSVVTGRLGASAEIRTVTEFPTPPSPEETFETIFRIADSVCGFSAVGISCGGPLDEKAGTILEPPNLPGWRNIPVTKLFSEKYSVPAYLKNDANAGALAEWLYGAGRGCGNMIFLTFGTGMGAGLILDGRLYAGTCSLAGEAGHIRLADDGPEGFGKAGSFEGFCSGGGIARAARALAGERTAAGRVTDLCPDGNISGITARTVFEGAAAGGADCMRIVATCAARLGQGLAVLIDLLNPERIVIGSIYARNRDLFDRLLEPALAAEAIPRARAACRILPAETGERIGEISALVTALYGEDYE